MNANGNVSETVSLFFSALLEDFPLYNYISEISALYKCLEKKCILEKMVRIIPVLNWNQMNK